MFDSLQRTVEDNCLHSSALPPMRVQFANSLDYLGNLKGTIYETAHIDNYYFAERDSNGIIQRIVYLQFENYFPDVDAPHDYPSAQAANRHVSLDAFRGFLAFGRGKDPGGEDDEVQSLRGQRCSDTLRLAHQAQVGLDELDSRNVGVAKRLTDDHDARAARCQESAKRAANAARSADDCDLQSLEVEALRIDTTPNQTLVSRHDG